MFESLISKTQISWFCIPTVLIVVLFVAIAYFHSTPVDHAAKKDPIQCGTKKHKTAATRAS